MSSVCHFEVVCKLEKSNLHICNSIQLEKTTVTICTFIIILNSTQFKSIRVHIWNMIKGHLSSSDGSLGLHHSKGWEPSLYSMLNDCTPLCYAGKHSHTV